jgi:peroxiredoxin
MKIEKAVSVGTQVLLGALVVASLLLLRQNLRLRGELVSPGVDNLAPGDFVEPFTARSFDGEITVSYGPLEKAKVFLFLSPSCAYCGKQMPYWQQLVDQIDKERFEVYTIARDSDSYEQLQDYLLSEHIDLVPTILAPDRVWRAYKLWGTPTTLVVSRDGSVIENWRGLWGAESRKEAATILGVTFHGA